MQLAALGEAAARQMVQPRDACLEEIPRCSRLLCAPSATTLNICAVGFDDAKRKERMDVGCWIGDVFRAHLGGGVTYWA